MGTGKTAVCQIMKQKLPGSVFLDGDWCWDMHPFCVTEETKAVVMDNICCLLNRFLCSPAFQYVIFCWVLQEQKILDEILSRLDTKDCTVHAVSLLCGQEALISRLRKDVARGIRRENVIERSLRYRLLYETLDTVKIDVTEITAEQAADQLCRLSGFCENRAVPGASAGRAGDRS